MKVKDIQPSLINYKNVLTVPSFDKIKFSFLLGFELKAVASGDHVLTLLLREYSIFLLSTERVFLKQSVNITFFIVTCLYDA